jgi:hypothetical protein
MSYSREREVGQTFAKTISSDNVVQFDALECRLHGKFGTIRFGPWSAVSGAGLNSAAKLEGTRVSAWMPIKKTTGKLSGQRGGVMTRQSSNEVNTRDHWSKAPAVERNRSGLVRNDKDVALSRDK